MLFIYISTSDSKVKSNFEPQILSCCRREVPSAQKIWKLEQSHDFWVNLICWRRSCDTIKSSSTATIKRGEVPRLTGGRPGDFMSQYVRSWWWEKNPFWSCWIAAWITHMMLVSLKIILPLKKVGVLGTWIEWLRNQKSWVLCLLV